ERLYDYLSARRQLRLIGPRTFGPNAVGTLSFRHLSLLPTEITSRVNRHQLGIKHASFYSIRLLRSIGINPDEGVVRISLVHYNSPEEIDRLIEVLDPLL